MDIDNMEAGPEMDALMAERVMGRSIMLIYHFDGKIAGALYDDHSEPDFGLSVPAYSTDIAAAWQVVEKMQSRGFRVAINSTCDVGLYDVTVGDAVHDFYCQVFVPAPLGICRAARKTVTEG